MTHFNKFQKINIFSHRGNFFSIKFTTTFKTCYNNNPTQQQQYISNQQQNSAASSSVSAFPVSIL